MDNTDIKLCKDCRYLKWKNYDKGRATWSVAYCKHESAVESTNIVDGCVNHKQAFQNRTYGSCGKDAVHFQPKRSFIQWLKEVL